MSVTFDGTNKLIICGSGTTSLDAEIDLYSEWKEWVSASDNSKYLEAMRTVGGDPTTGSNSIAPYFFLINGWRIRPQEANHTLTVTGNLFVDGGGSPFVSTVGSYNVLINLVLSNNAVTVSVSSGSGLSTEEHNKLFSIPDDVWSVDSDTFTSGTAGGTLQSANINAANAFASS